MSTNTSSPIKVGFIGLSTQGWGNNFLAPSLLSPSLRSKYTLTSLATTNPTSAAASSEKWSKEAGYDVKGYSNAEDLIKDGNVDLVVVSVKTPSHKELLLPAIQAGKDVFIEWPAGKSAQETRDIAAEAAKYGVRTIVNLESRFSPFMNKVKEIIASGKIGKVLSTNWNGLFPREMRQWAPEAVNVSTYVLDPANGATLLTIPGGHHIDMFTHVLGAHFVSISAIGTKHYKTTTFFDAVTQQPTGESQPAPNFPDHFTYTGVLDNGALATVTWRQGAKAFTPGRTILTWEIEGEEGTIKITSSQMMGAMMGGVFAELFVNGEKVEVPEEAALGGINGYLVANWEEYAKGEGVGNYPTVQDAVKVKRVIEAIEESLETGKRVAI